MGEAIGGKSIDLEWVQVHPTGLVKPDDPDAKIKVLAAEALHGVGGLVFGANGGSFFLAFNVNGYMVCVFKKFLVYYFVLYYFILLLKTTF